MVALSAAKLESLPYGCVELTQFKVWGGGGGGTDTLCGPDITRATMKLYRLLTVFISLTLCSKRRHNTPTSSDTPSKRLRGSIEDDIDISLLQICVKGSVEELLGAFPNADFNTCTSTSFKQKCFAEALSSGNMEIFSHLLDYNFEVTDIIARMVLESTDPNIPLIFAEKRTTILIELIRAFPSQYASAIFDAKTTVGCHILSLLPSECVKKMAMFIVDVSNVDLCIRAVAMIRAEDRRAVLFILLDKAIFSRWMPMIVWILATLKIPLIEDRDCNIQRFNHDLHLVANADIATIVKAHFSKNHINAIGCTFIAYAALWLGRLDVYKMVNEKAQWLVRPYSFSGARLSVTSGAFLDLFAQDERFYSDSSVEEMIMHFAELGQYEHVSQVVDVIDQRWQGHRPLRSFPRNTRITSILNLIYLVKNFRLNEILCFMEQHPLELMIRYSLIDLWFNPSFCHFAPLISCALYS